MEIYFKLTKTNNAMEPLNNARVTALRSLDGGDFVPCSNKARELGEGMYVITLNDDETECFRLELSFVAPGGNAASQSLVMKQKTHSPVIKDLVDSLKALPESEDPFPLIWMLTDALEADGKMDLTNKLNDTEITWTFDGWVCRTEQDVSIHRKQQQAWGWLKMTVLTWLDHHLEDNHE